MAKTQESRKKSKLFRSRLQTDPSYARIRENLSEFSEAGKAAKLIRNAFRSKIKGVSGTSMVPRMQKALMEVVKSDTTSDRGARKVTKGDLSSLKGFDFSAKALLKTNLYAQCKSSIDRAAGKTTVDVAPFIATTGVSAPIYTTHFRIISAAAEFDFQQDEYLLSESSSELIPWVNTEIAAIKLENQLTANTKLALILVLGVEFFQEVNGKMYLLKDDAHSSLAVAIAENAVA